MLRVRRTAERDVPVVVAIEAGPDTAEWVGEKGEEWHRAALTDPDQEHLVVEYSAGEVVGFGVLAGLLGPRQTVGRQQADPADLPDRSIEIRRLALAISHRGGGQGRRLVQMLLTRAYREHRADEVWLDLRIDNDRARALYESVGFWPERVVPEGLMVAEDTAFDLLIMRHDGSRMRA